MDSTTSTNVTELIGWASSFTLILTIFKQLYTQYRERSSKGVSKWLYIGQVLAEVGFVAYSWLLHSWVFVVTNAVLLVENAVGIAMVLHYRRAERRAPRTGSRSDSAAALAASVASATASATAGTANAPVTVTVTMNADDTAA